MYRIAIATLFAGTAVAASGQIATQRPMIPAKPKVQPTPTPTPTPGVFQGQVVDAGAYQPTPAEVEAKNNPLPRNIGSSFDRKGWIASIDGKGPRYGSNGYGITFSLGSEHVLRGKGFDGFVSAFVTSMRRPGNQAKYETVGSVLVPVRQSDTELVLRVTQIMAGKLPWSASQTRQSGDLRLRVTTAGGGRVITAMLMSSSYRCANGEPNCAP